MIVKTLPLNHSLKMLESKELKDYMINFSESKANWLRIGERHFLLVGANILSFSS